MKNMNEFYTGRVRCIDCHNHCEYKLELYKCEICNITIRKVYKSRHDKSRRHYLCRFYSEEFDADRLQKQNQRRIVET